MNSVKKTLQEILDKKVAYNDEPPIWLPNMTVLNASGDVNDTSMGYKYSLYTTSQLRAKVLQQKFYEIAPADFMSVAVGTGAWMDEIKTNREFSVFGPFVSGIVGTQARSRVGNVDVITSPLTTRIYTWAGGYTYSIVELEKALAANQWNVVEGRMSALKKMWDLGIQEVAFLGIKSDLTNCPGLLTNSDVTINTTRITAKISGLSTANFSTFVQNIVNDYIQNCALTQFPNRFIMPMSDYVGLASPVSQDFPTVSKLEYLLNAFKVATGKNDFQIKPLAYCDAARNATWINGATGKNRYVLYNDNSDTVLMDIPVDFKLFPAGTANNFHFEGVGAGQFSGPVIFRPAEFLYFDWV